MGLYIYLLTFSWSKIKLKNENYAVNRVRTFLSFLSHPLQTLAEIVYFFFAISMQRYRFFFPGNSLGVTHSLEIVKIVFFFPKNRNPGKSLQATHPWRRLFRPPKLPKNGCQLGKKLQFFGPFSFYAL